MAVFKRGYERYTGPRTGALARFLVVPRFAWPKLLGERFVVVLLIVSLFWPLLCAGFVYLSNHASLLPASPKQATPCRNCSASMARSSPPS